MDFKQLQSFICVVNNHSFTKTAERLHVSQPTVTTHIHALENELGQQLLKRTTKNLEITQKGMEFYECAVQMMSLRDNLLTRWEENTQNVIQLGVSSVPASYILPTVLPAFQAQYPDVRFMIHQLDSHGVIDGLTSGLFDIGIVGMKRHHSQIRYTPFCRDSMVLITPATPHYRQLAEDQVPAYDILCQEPVLLREFGKDNQKSSDHMIESMGISMRDLHIAARINDPETIRSLVVGGIGVSVVSEKMVLDQIAQGLMLEFPLPISSADRLFYFAECTEYTTSAQIETFKEFTLQKYSDTLSSIS